MSSEKNCIAAFHSMCVMTENQDSSKETLMSASLIPLELATLKV